MLEGLLFGQCVVDVLKGGQSEGRDPLRRIIAVVPARDGGGLEAERN